MSSLPTRLELYVNSLSDAHVEDKNRIEELERELSNCFQEIDYLQDQLNTRDVELNCLGEQICSLQLRLAELEKQAEEVGRLKEQIKRSESERSFLIRELEDKDEELRNSRLCIDKLEESISSVGLEYECEIETLKLDFLAVEQNLFETKKLQLETTLERARRNELIQDLELQIQDSKRIIENLDKENKILKQQIKTYDLEAKVFVEKLEGQLPDWLGKVDDQNSPLLETCISTCGNILGPLLCRFAILETMDIDMKKKIDQMSQQMEEYQFLVRQLKEDLRKERVKAKEEAEDLGQEMAELRYQMTSLLEEECKRRARVEQLSLQRIAELEAELGKEQRKSYTHQKLEIRRTH